MLHEQIEEEADGTRTGFFLSAFNSMKLEKQSEKLSSCLSKVENSQQMHNHLLLFLSCRVLKVFRQLIEHDVPVDRVCLDTFRDIEKY